LISIQLAPLHQGAASEERELHGERAGAVEAQGEAVQAKPMNKKAPGTKRLTL
jgi:hypothetical protein